MSCMTETVLREPLIDTLSPDQIISTECMIIDFNLEKMKASDVEFSTTYEVVFTKNDTFHGLVSWFDTPFDTMEKRVNLSTSPYKKATHWKQTTFFINEPFNVRKGDTLKGSIAVRKSKTNFRE